jgi:hypothetical protein
MEEEATLLFVSYFSPAVVEGQVEAHVGPPWEMMIKILAEI